MELQGLPRMQTKANPGFFKRNPPIVGDTYLTELLKR